MTDFCIFLNVPIVREIKIVAQLVNFNCNIFLAIILLCGGVCLVLYTSREGFQGEMRDDTVPPPLAAHSYFLQKYHFHKSRFRCTSNI